MMPTVRKKLAVRLKVSKTLRSLREQRGLSRSAVRERAWETCRVSLVGLPQIERSERRPTPHQLEALRLVLNVSERDFLRLCSALRRAWGGDAFIPVIYAVDQWQAWLAGQTPVPPRTRLVAAPYPGGIHLRAMNASRPMKVRVTPEEADLVRRAAAASGKLPATWIRDTILDAVDEGDTSFFVEPAPLDKAAVREPMPYRLPDSALLSQKLVRLRNGTPLALWVRYLVVDRARATLGVVSPNDLERAGREAARAS